MPDEERADRVRRRRVIVVWASIAVVVLGVWQFYAHADRLTADCGGLMVIAQLDGLSIQRFYGGGSVWHVLQEEVMEARMMRASDRAIAGIYRDAFGWGLFPPEGVQNARKQFWLEWELAKLRGEIEID